MGLRLSAGAPCSGVSSEGLGFTPAPVVLGLWVPPGQSPTLFSLIAHSSEGKDWLSRSPQDSPCQASITSFPPSLQPLLKAP